MYIYIYIINICTSTIPMFIKEEDGDHKVREAWMDDMPGCLCQMCSGGFVPLNPGIPYSILACSRRIVKYIFFGPCPVYKGLTQLQHIPRRVLPSAGYNRVALCSCTCSSPKAANRR